MFEFELLLCNIFDAKFMYEAKQVIIMNYIIRKYIMIRTPSLLSCGCNC